MMHNVMVNLSNIRLTFGERVLIRDGSFLIRPKDKIGLVGPNGAGKTSIFRIITGEEKPDGGTVSIESGKTVGYFSQDVGEMSGHSALTEVLSGAGNIWEMGNELTELEHRMCEPMDDGEMDRLMNRYGELQMKYQNGGGYTLENDARTILNGLGIGEDRWDDPVENFSGGWKMRISLARILLLNPDVLLIDEPTNHLDIETIQWLEQWLMEFKGALVMTSHDREFMTRICSRTVEIASGEITVYSGDYDFYMKERVIRRELLVATKKKQDAMLAKDEEFIARFAARASHAAQVQSRVKKIEKIERIIIPPEPKVMKIRLKELKRSGDIVVTMNRLGKSWKNPVFSGLDAVINRTDKIALTGVNGAGKSTLLKVISGLTDPTEGSCSLGASVSAGYFSQYSNDLLDNNNTIYEEVSARLPDETLGSIRNLLGSFQFSGDDADKKIGVLSGGEKSRVVLACLMAQSHNFLIFDEPTNHLDINSREVLLEALQEYGGTLIIVSHDRYFLRHLVNRVFEIDHGKLNIYEGDYDYYLSRTQSLYR